MSRESKQSLPTKTAACALVWNAAQLVLRGMDAHWPRTRRCLDPLEQKAGQCSL
jgi:hypothetical protein